MSSAPGGPPLLLVVALVAAGCTGSGSALDDNEAPPDDGDYGRVLVRILDTEFVPLGNATVTLRPVDMERTSGDDGTVEFPFVPVGSHEAFAYRIGYEPAARAFEVRLGETTEFFFTLNALPANGSYYEHFPYAGLQPCQWYVEGTIAHCTLPYTQAHGTLRGQGVNLSQYGAPPDLQDNRDKFNFTVRQDHTGVVSELFWRPGSFGAAYQILVIMCPWYDPLWDECVPPGSPAGTVGVRYFTKVGTSPIKIEWKHPSPEHHRLTDWVTSRANVNGDDTHPVGVSIDQRIDMYNTVFYGADPPPDFSAGPTDV